MNTKGNKMSAYSDLIKGNIQKAMDRYFGEGNTRYRSNKRFYYKSVLNDDEIIIRTKNVRFFKGNPVLVVGSNDVVYLKDWQILKAHCWEEDLREDFYLVKLNRNYFKVYHFLECVYGFELAEPADFDALVKCAEEQQSENLPVARGFMNF